MIQRKNPADRSGAKRILFLDFDGHLISGTGWNTSYNGGRDIVAPPWDIDGDPTTFGDVERTRIQQIWQRVAEDYAPFDVNVTTELTSESQITGSRARGQRQRDARQRHRTVTRAARRLGLV